jgi:hypothetical protein
MAWSAGTLRKICTTNWSSTTGGLADAEPDTAIGIWSEYSHELSVGVAYNYDTDVSRLCFFVASLVAALADGETLGLFHLDSGRLWRVDHEIVERLRSEPEGFFGLNQTR